MPLALAQALYRASAIEEFDALGDCRSLFALGLWALQFSPEVALDPLLSETLTHEKACDLPRLANGIIINIGGTDRLHKSEERLLALIEQAFKERGYRIRCAITRSIGASWALSRFDRGGHRIIPHHAPLINELAPLPLEALRIAPEAAAALRETGLNTIGDIYAMPRRPLAERFGLNLVKRLDQAIGALDEQLSWISTRKTYALSRRFSAPLWNATAVQETVKKLFSALHEQLAKDGNVSRHFIVQLKPELRSGAAIIRKELLLNTPSSDGSKIAHIIEPFTTSLQTGSAGIEECSIIALSPSKARTEQYQLPGLEDRNDALSRAEFEHILNQYAARFGAEKIKRVSFLQHHQPEQSFRFLPIEKHQAATALQYKKDFPSFIFPHPEEVTVIALLPDYAPAMIHWRKKKIRIIQSRAPEKINGEWWSSAASNSPRTYFKIQEEKGRWLWLFREERTMRWFVHGVWT